ncbi:hypothetical protein, partial [Photobacterium damselae]|uniref:hypothetical protein n=1 Tax=Photobacterium damselae TaxID=38293 RepID=UPI004068A42A
LAAKVDALRAKGFSDEEIENLVAPSAQATSETPFNIGEIFNNGASAKEWNQNVDDTEQLYIKEGSIGVVVLGIGAIALILGVKGYYPIEIAGAIVTGALFLNMLVLTYFMPKYREKMKFFVKKRR